MPVQACSGHSSTKLWLHPKVRSCPVHLAALHVRPQRYSKLQKPFRTARLQHRRKVAAFTKTARLSERNDEPQALMFVRFLRQELQKSSGEQPSSACRLFMYRLTELCISGDQTAVWEALAQDNNAHHGNGVLTAVAHLLGSKDESCQSLAADLLVALMRDLPEKASPNQDTLPGWGPDWQMLDIPAAALPIDGFVNLVASSAAPKVKAAAALLLLLVVMQHQPSGALLAENGVATIVYAQIVQAALSWGSDTDSAEQMEKVLWGMKNGGVELSSCPPMIQDMAASLPFMAASKALVSQLIGCNKGPMTMGRRMQTLAFYTAFSVISHCKWTPAAAAPEPIDSDNTFKRATNWLKKQSNYDKTADKWRFTRLFSACASLSVGSDDLDTMGSLLELCVELQCSMKQAEGFVASTQGNASAAAVEGLESCLKFTTGLERHTVARSFVPYLVDMLQHPSPVSRGAAANHLTRLTEYAPAAVATALLQSPDDGLGGLLKCLASEDSPEHRAQYAFLIGACAETGDGAAVMKKISDAGAAPYLLTLLKQADAVEAKAQTLTCLGACAQKSPEIATSIAVHGGISQLLEVIRSGLQQAETDASKLMGEDIAIFTCALTTLHTVMQVQGAARDQQLDQQLVSELPALLMRSIQSPGYGSLPGLHLVALHCLSGLCEQSGAGKKHVLDSLTHDSTTAVLEGVLSLLEEGHPERVENLAAVREVSHKVLVQPAMLARISQLLTKPPSDAVQAYVLPICAALTVLREDGSFAPSPWLLKPSSLCLHAPDLDATLVAPFLRPPPQQPTQLHSAQDAQALLAAAADRVIQRNLPRVNTSDKTVSDASSSRDKTSDKSGSETATGQDLDVQALLAAAADRVSQRGSAASSSSETTQSASGTQPSASQRSDPESDSPSSEILNIAGRSNTASARTSAANTQEVSRSTQSKFTNSASNTDRTGSASSSSETSTSGSSLSLSGHGSQASDPVQLAGLSGKALHDALVNTATSLMLQGDEEITRSRAAGWLSVLPPALSDSACRELAACGAVQASLYLIKKAKRWETRTNALALCLRLNHRGVLPIDVLLDGKAHKILPKVIVKAASAKDDEYTALSCAGCLLWILWQQQPNLVADFAAQKQPAALLKMMADEDIPPPARMVCTALVHQVWMYTASLVSEPLLVQAIPQLVRNGVAYELETVTSEQQTLMVAQLQEESIALLCTMADFAFYRPAIRDAEPTEALADMIHAGCSQSDSYQQRQMAQLAINLIYKLMKGQRDGSDGLDARHNTRFFTAVSMNELVQPSIIAMCKRGSTESRHGALAALQQILSGCAYHQMDPMQSAELQISLISHGLVPMLFGILTAPDSTAEMRKMAQGCVATLDGDHNEFAARLGCYCLLAKLTAGSVFLYKQGVDADRHSR